MCVSNNIGIYIWKHAEQNTRDEINDKVYGGGMQLINAYVVVLSHSRANKWGML